MPHTSYGPADVVIPHTAQRRGHAIEGHLYPTSCDTVVVLGDLTADGSVLLAKNSDRRGHEAQRLIGVRPKMHATGDVLACQYLTIPQAPRTAALIGSQPYWLWGFEHGMNEYGVAIGNEAIHTREVAQERGLLGMDLVRLGLERGATARHALDTITALLEEFGQGGSAEHHFFRTYDNSFLIADPREAWVLETCGRHWVARHVTSGGYAISNRPTIGTEYDLISAGMIAHAEARGWWPKGRRPFDFADACTNPDNPGLPRATCRLARSRTHIARHTAPLATPRHMMELLRDHGTPLDEGDAWLRWPTGAEPATVCMHGDESFGSTAASMVTHLRDEGRSVAWTSLAPPCTGIFIPIWVDVGPPERLAVADEAASDASPWWRFRAIWEAVAASTDPAVRVETIRRLWEPLETYVTDTVQHLPADATVEARRVISEQALSRTLDGVAAIDRTIALVAAR